MSLFAFVLLVMLPVKLAAQSAGIGEAEAARLAWQLGLAACLLSALIELAGALVAEQVRRSTPRAALLSTLAGIAVSFIAIDFAIQTFAAPLVAILPLGVILTTYFCAHPAAVAHSRRRVGAGARQRRGLAARGARRAERR